MFFFFNYILYWVFYAAAAAAVLLLSMVVNFFLSLPHIGASGEGHRDPDVRRPRRGRVRGSAQRAQHGGRAQVQAHALRVLGRADGGVAGAAAGPGQGTHTLISSYVDRPGRCTNMTA